MENQHRKIKGYRDLSQEEVDLMNKIKEKGSEMISLTSELSEMLNSQLEKKRSARYFPKGEYRGDASKENKEMERFIAAEPFKWLTAGKTNIQTGVMALVRAIAQPDGV